MGLSLARSVGMALSALSLAASAHAQGESPVSYGLEDRILCQRAIEQVQGVGGKVLGVVLNKVNLERNSYYYSQYYGEYYRNYYAEGVSASRRADETPRKPAPRTTARPSRRA